MIVDGAMQVADAVLFEGYMLYPYRANDPKNRVRWQFGVLAPPAFAKRDPSERTFLQTDCLLEGHDVELQVHTRFLHVQRRSVEALHDGSYVPVESLDVGDATFLPWDEAVVHETTATVTLPGLRPHADSVPISVPAAAEFEPLIAEGRTVGRLARDRVALDAVLSVAADPMPGPYGVRRITVRLENRTAWSANGSGAPDRPDALRHALVAAHLLLEADHGGFVSLIEPPEWARAFADRCEQSGAFPVLAGPSGDRSTVLASPIILYDHPEVAPESASQFCDATEMDEMLTLRTLTLTEKEKRQVRGSDARGAALVDELDDLSPELLDRLHGAIRSMTSVARPAAALPQPTPWWDPAAEAAVDPDTDFVLVDGTPVGRGSAVRLRPGARRADAQDMFLDGRTATVEAVLSDVDGGHHLAVTLDELAEDGYNPHGRFLYFAPDEVDPISAATS